MLPNLWKKLICCNLKEDDKVEEKYFDQYKPNDGFKQPTKQETEEEKAKSPAKNDYRIEFFKPSGKITFFGAKDSTVSLQRESNPAVTES